MFPGSEALFTLIQLDSLRHLKPTSFALSISPNENFSLCLSTQIYPWSMHLISLQDYFPGPIEFIRDFLELVTCFQLALECSRMSEFVNFFARCHLCQPELSHSPRLYSDFHPNFVPPQLLMVSLNLCSYHSKKVAIFFLLHSLLLFRD